jgi:O-antigen/teichoic acid export membrane protein
MLLTDLDKIVVSKMLPLEEFGYYSLAWRMASTLYVLSSPVFASFLPALTRFVTSKDEPRLVEAYHRGAQLMSVLVLPPAITMVFFSKALIFAWTGSRLTAGHTCHLASLLTAGTAFNCLVTIPWALQLAHGWTSLAFWTNLTSTAVTIPLLLILTKRYGGIGAASVWLLINASYLATQVHLMHRWLLTKERLVWYFQDFSAPLASCVLVALVVSHLAITYTSRIQALLLGCSSTGLFLLVALLACPIVRNQIGHLVTKERRA